MLIPIKATITIDSKGNLISQQYEYFDLSTSKELKDKVLQAFCENLLKIEEVKQNEN